MPAPAGFPVRRWLAQIGAIVRLELKKGFLGRRSIWLYLLAAAPLTILVLRWLWSSDSEGANVSNATNFLAALYQIFVLRMVIFLSCVGIFGNLIRREVLDRSLHYYFLSPLRRELLVIAKYVTGLVVSFSVFGVATVAAFGLAYLPHDSHAVRQFLFSGPGLGHLGSYVLVTALACIGYGAVFLAFGFYFKSPIVPALVVLGWEQVNFLLPPLLKKVSVIHYLKGLCPVPIPEAPIAYLADAPPAWVSILGILALAAALVYISTFRIRKMEISYEET
jgi:uncharacterized membrane protein